MPAAAFEEAVFSLMQLARGAEPAQGKLAGMLAEDAVALVGVRIPQIPSSRAPGTWPAASPREYLNALPADPADLKVIPVPPRPFPQGLRDPDLRPAPPRRSTLPIVLWAATGILPLAWIAGAIWRALRPARR
jgi:hypothetical protein